MYLLTRPPRWRILPSFTVWLSMASSSAERHRKRVFTLQKRALYNLNGKVSCRKTFKQGRILTLFAIYILTVAKYIHFNQAYFSKNAMEVTE